MSYVSLFAEHYALLMDGHGAGLYDPFASALELAGSLAYSEVPGFIDPERSHWISIAKIYHVMPKTFDGALAVELRDGQVHGFHRRNRRMPRGHVIACAQSVDAATVLRDKLLKIGIDADRQIETELDASAELRDLKNKVREIEGGIALGVRQIARDSVHHSLPELFGPRQRTRA